MSLWFGSPWWWWPGVVVLVGSAVALAVAVGVGRRRRQRLMGTRAGGPDTGHLGDMALWLALLAIVVGGLGPRLGDGIVRINGSGADLVILLDTSRSMDAEDVAPSRLDRARRAARDVLAKLPPESRAALAAFSGRGVLFTPLTPDHDAVSQLLPAIGSDLIRPGGSDLEAGIEASIDAFDEVSTRPRVLLVLSDGETVGRQEDSGETALRTGRVRLLAAPLGSPLGSTVPDHGTPLRDGAGEIVVSRRRDATLQRLADATAGTLFASDEFGRFDVDAVVAAIHRDTAATENEFVERAVTVPVVWPFVVVAFALLWLEAVAGASWFRRLATRALRVLPRRTAPKGLRGPARPTSPAVARAAVLVPLLLLVAAANQPDGETDAIRTAEERVAVLEARARLGTLTPRELVALGVARSELGNTDGADHAFRAAALTTDDPAVAAAAYHDLGVSALERGDLEAARAAFFDALARSDDGGRQTNETRFNLEWTLAALRSQPEERPPPRRPEPDEDGREREQPDPEPSDEEDLDELEPDGSTAAPEPPDREAPQPDSPDGPTPTPVAGGDEPPPLSSAERRQWLERIEDDPGRALRTAVASGRDEKPRRAGPTW